MGKNADSKVGYTISSILPYKKKSSINSRFCNVDGFVVFLSLSITFSHWGTLAKGFRMMWSLGFGLWVSPISSTPTPLSLSSAATTHRYRPGCVSRGRILGRAKANTEDSHARLGNASYHMFHFPKLCRMLFFLPRAFIFRQYHGK